jgi:hypothetical protein
MSGAGKTRLILDGLCVNWGFYISCPNRAIGTSGSLDFKVATATLPGMSGWNRNGEVTNENACLADVVFSMLLLARIYVLLRFLRAVPSGESLANTRRRWVFLQIMPASSNGDIFTEILQDLRHGDGTDMLKLARTLLRNCRGMREFFPQGESTPLYCAIDEVQEGLKIHKDMFSSTSGQGRHPALHALYRFLVETKLFDGFIISGTGLSMKKLEDGLGSYFAKRIGEPPVLFTDTVHFTREESDKAQRNYIHRYLGSSGGNHSD